MGIVRKTKSVVKVLELFEDATAAKSVVDIVALVKNSMNKTTVYRILDRLEQDGVIHSFNGKDGLKWYAKCTGCSAKHHTDSHPHFQCNTCDKIECLPVEVSIPSYKKHKIETADILLFGQCEACSS